MDYTTFGRNNGLRVSEIALGTGNFGTAWGVGAEMPEAREIFRRFAEAGGTFIDTADNYQNGESESFLGELLASDRDHFILATKYSRGAGTPPEITMAGNSRRAMIHSVEQSLRRLNTDRIDLFWAHYDDSVTPMEEVLSTFDDLVAAGKILYCGLSNFSAWRVARGQTIAELRGLAPIAGIQIEHSLVERSAERDLLPMAEAFGIGAALYSPLGGGLLSGIHRRGKSGARPIVVYREDSSHRTAVVDALERIATGIGRPLSQVAVAWQRALNARSCTALVTVIGPRTVAQLEDYLAALDEGLSDSDYEELSSASVIDLGVPYDGIGGPPDLGDSRTLASRAVPVL